MLFLATVINYVDRQVFSILAREIQNDLHVSDLGYSVVVQVFLVAYTLGYLLAGRITDRLGSRLSMAVFIVWWSMADMLTAFAQTVFSLGVYRCLLGLGEPGNYTGYSKAISEWFPPQERGFAFALCTAGATTGATVAVPVIAFLGAQYGWRATFVFTGLLGLLWVIPWFWLHRLASEHPKHSAPPERRSPARIPDPERMRTSGLPRNLISPPGGDSEWQRWKQMLADKNTWLLALARFLTDPVWYFYVFWFPKYLIDVRSMSLIRVGELAWIVYLAADAGTILGGWASGFLIKHGMAPVSARKKIMVFAALVVPFSPLVALAPTVTLALCIASVVVLAQLAWQVNLGTLIIDVYPQRFVATVFGIITAGSGLGGFLFTNAVGHLVTAFSYKPVFVLMAFLHPCALLLLWRIRIRLPLSEMGA
jgi:MFS transporter, ACS family, hexuronate transporter